MRRLNKDWSQGRVYEVDSEGVAHVRPMSQADVDEIFASAKDEPFAQRTFPDGRTAEVWGLMLGRAELGIGRGGPCWDDSWYYEKPEAAVKALLEWDPATNPTPPGPNMHPGDEPDQQGGF